MTFENQLSLWLRWRQQLHAPKLAKLTQLTNELNQDMVYAKQTIGTLMSIQIAQQHTRDDQRLATA
eukprot:COSAG01_NODE_539_length_15749_cov_21.448307_5_plen_66_part_00